MTCIYPPPDITPSTTANRATRRSRRRRAAAAAILAASLSATLVALQVPGKAGAQPVAPAPATTFNLFIPGTWETDQSADPHTATGMLAPVAQRIKRDHGDSAVIEFLPYVARAFDNGQSYAASKASAVASASAVLRDYAAAHPDADFTISGYSQGADAAGDLASAIGNGEGPIPADKVLAVGLLADPRAGTAGETVVGPRRAGTGIADPRPEGMGALSGRVDTICDPEDLYCSVDKARNPLIGKIGTLLGSSDEEAAVAVAEAEDAASVLTPVDLPAIIDALNRLPRTVAVGDLTAAHVIAGDLNNRLHPLVELAARVDYATVSKVLALIPDETGFTKVASLLTAMLARLDIVRAATLAGDVQELAWTLINPADPAATSQTATSTDSIPADGAPGDPSPSAPGEPAQSPGATAAATQNAQTARPARRSDSSDSEPRPTPAVPPPASPPAAVGPAAHADLLARLAEIGSEAAILASEFVSGTHVPDGAVTSIGSDLAGMAAELTRIVTDCAISDPATLIRDAISAATFYTDQSHASYDSLVVDDQGHDAVDWLGAWLSSSIDEADAGPP